MGVIIEVASEVAGVGPGVEEEVVVATGVEMEGAIDFFSKIFHPNIFNFFMFEKKEKNYLNYCTAVDSSRLLLFQKSTVGYKSCNAFPLPYLCSNSHNC